jgi:hypothetical protein
LRIRHNGQYPVAGGGLIKAIAPRQFFAGGERMSALMPSKRRRARGHRPEIAQ